MEPVNETREPGTPASASYEPPKIEKVLTADDLAREVQYAGAVSLDGVADA